MNWPSDLPIHFNQVYKVVIEDRKLCSDTDGTTPFYSVHNVMRVAVARTVSSFAAGTMFEFKPHKHACYCATVKTKPVCIYTFKNISDHGLKLVYNHLKEVFADAPANFKDASDWIRLHGGATMSTPRQNTDTPAPPILLERLPLRKIGLECMTGTVEKILQMPVHQPELRAWVRPDACVLDYEPTELDKANFLEG